MDNKEVFSTLSDIRNLMEKSSKFLSLNGLSSIFVGIYACIGAAAAYYILGEYAVMSDSYTPLRLNVNTPYKLRLLLLFASALVVLCIGTVVLMSRYKARKSNQQLRLDKTARRLLWNFFLPLLAGGILCLSLIYQQHYGLTSSIMLIFYGLALISASNYTYSHTRYLGYAELLLGLADSFFEGQALLFWVAGFGFFHIIYGIFFYLKYDRKHSTNKQQG